MNKTDNHLFYENIAIGDEMGPLVKHISPRQLVMWAAAADDYYEIHYNVEIAREKGLTGVIAQGQLIGCFLGQLATDWMGTSGLLKRLLCSYRAMVFPGQTLICKGAISNKYIREGEHLIECNMWVENPEGEKVVTGTGTILLPAANQENET